MSKVWITTKSGDFGETSLGNGKRVPKDDLRVEVYGTLDECQAHVGMARAFCELKEIYDTLYWMEEQLGLLMGYISLYPGLSCPDVNALEEIVEKVGTITGQKFRFIRPGDSKTGAALHVARTVARRAERVALKLYRTKELPLEGYTYINRLSDAIYALSLWYDHAIRNEESL
ncbi:MULTISPECIES: cob(I)yrinic acid a,c-diamide adenosyltransferase [Aminobacterium]|uniref:cob(I)yrinic acid a,c-diamide adenosyltransferase n=1 Tax=Aminobacterium TaxID=81466 RepID=UPI000463EFCA|nr:MULTISPECIES: cob(I)yrinic acid a,c-diamide adenosyltransferase [Aminobacterium]